VVAGGEPLTPPLILSVAYSYDVDALARGVDETVEVKYARENSLTTMLLERRLAQLESASWSLAFNTGMAAIATLLLHHRLKGGGGVVASRLVYGSTRELIGLLAGGSASFHGPPWDELLSAADRPGVELVFVETLGNPTLRIPPLDSLSKICSGRGCMLVVDNTMATPVLYRPLEAGASLVVESLTKYIIGGNDAMGGAIAGRDDGLRRSLWRLRKLTGTILQPVQAYQALQGLETVKLRVERMSKTALEVARWLEESGLVERVYYPCLPSHPDYKNARRLLRGGCGGVVSFDVGSRSRALEILRGLRRIRPAPSFGIYRPVISYPYASSHRSLPEEEKKALGITPGLLRLSVGVADAEEIIGELEQLLRRG
jgi:cystathionine gamma-synthase